MESLTNFKRSKLPTSLKDPFLHGCKFTNCGMHGTSYPIRPRGSWEAEADWIGEGGGLHEEKNNCTFIGPAGQLVEEELQNLGLSLDKDFLCPNVTLCRPHPPKGSKKQNRTPTVGEIRVCRSHLEKIISLHKPKLIVAVGGPAAKSVLIEPKSISQVAGKFFSEKEHNLDVEADLYCIFHPAYILRNTDFKPEWIMQLTRLRDYMLGRRLVK